MRLTLACRTEPLRTTLHQNSGSSVMISEWGNIVKTDEVDLVARTMLGNLEQITHS